MAALADRLDTDIQSLIGEVEVLEIQPQVMTNGAAALIEEAAQTKITGEEERYSGTDLVTLQANVDGANRSSTSCRRCSRPSTRSSTTISRRQFTKVQATPRQLQDVRRIRAVRPGERSRPSQAQDVDGRAERAAQPGLGLARPPSERVGRLPTSPWLLASSPSRWRGRRLTAGVGRGSRSLLAACATTPTPRLLATPPAPPRPASHSKVEHQPGSPHRRSVTRSSPAFDITAADRGRARLVFRSATTETRGLMAGEVGRSAQQAAATARQPDRRCRASARRPDDHARCRAPRCSTTATASPTASRRSSSPCRRSRTTSHTPTRVTATCSCRSAPRRPRDATTRCDV